MRAATKQARLSTSSVAEAQPHQVRSSSYYQRSLVSRSRERAPGSIAYALSRPRLKHQWLGYGRHNPMVARIREIMHVHTTNLKQTGRRYGPSPNLDGVHEPWPNRQPTPKGRRAAKLAAKHARLEASK
jgi:hypothetical protein